MSATAIILCLGQASRMRPLSLFRPKPLLPFCGRPLVEYTLEELIRNGIDHIVIACGLGNEYEHYQSWGGGKGASIEIAKRDLDLGSAGAVRDISENLDGCREDVLVIYGDSLISMDFAGLLASHRLRKRDGCQISMVHHTPHDLIVPGKAITNYGVISLAGDGRIIEFKEKPKVEDISSFFAYAGVLVIRQAAFQFFPKYLPLDFSRDIIPGFIEDTNGLVFGADIGGGYRYDIGTPQDYVGRQFDVLSGRIGLRGIPKSLLHEPAEDDFIEGRAFLGVGCSIGEGVKLKGMVIINEGVSIGSYTIVENSVVLEGTAIGCNSILDGAVVGSSCSIGDGVIIETGSVIGDFSVIN